MQTESVLVANRGEIARRVIRTVRRLGLRAVAIHSEADAELPFVREADEAVPVGPADPAKSYLDVDRVLEAAKSTGATAVHPGYGFLAERADFARRVAAAGLTWIGPSPEAMEQMGDKINARNLMEAAGVPVAPGTREPVTEPSRAVKEAARIGYPVMVKASGGGGGIGMGVARDEAGLTKAFEAASRAALRFGGAPAVLLERYVERARHVEVQILGLADGTVIALGERDCSVQRRHQKVVEETPSPGVTGELRERMLKAAVRAGEVVAYRGAGTVEFLVDTERQDFMFLEMNTRLQVEHPVTELVTGIDLVEQQLRAAWGEPCPVSVGTAGHAIEFRVYAEDPTRFLPGPGRITVWDEPVGVGVRVDSGYEAGNTVTPFYDPLMAKLCVHGETRAQALERARGAVAAFRIEGPKHNLPFFAELLARADFASGDYDTGLVFRMRS
ncbi:acetyl-CoA carboxylase biotin carboxylase subunit [Sinosporangium album]|uniref:acetyl-CoA carboxylase biotin carboxylase subunit n=1 Tax=Sinosporangium album TaxID=504805 RepID=UPI000B80CFED|nr:biotin carboxylase N-terminal domain-containing protein [Sinosporangium album]